jgi:hypothetical protein
LAILDLEETCMMAASGVWRRKCGYIVYIRKDGYISKCFSETDADAKVRVLKKPCHLEAFRQRLLRKDELTFAD